MAPIAPASNHSTHSVISYHPATFLRELAKTIYVDNPLTGLTTPFSADLTPLTVAQYMQSLHAWGTGIAAQGISPAVALEQPNDAGASTSTATPSSDISKKYKLLLDLFSPNAEAVREANWQHQDDSSFSAYLRRTDLFGRLKFYDWLTGKIPARLDARLLNGSNLLPFLQQMQVMLEIIKNPATSLQKAQSLISKIAGMPWNECLAGSTSNFLKLNNSELVKDPLAQKTIETLDSLTKVFSQYAMTNYGKHTTTHLAVLLGLPNEIMQKYFSFPAFSGGKLIAIEKVLELHQTDFLKNIATSFYFDVQRVLLQLTHFEERIHQTQEEINALKQNPNKYLDDLAKAQTYLLRLYQRVDILFKKEYHILAPLLQGKDIFSDGENATAATFDLAFMLKKIYAQNQTNLSAREFKNRLTQAFTAQTENWKVAPVQQKNESQFFFQYLQNLRETPELQTNELLQDVLNKLEIACKDLLNIDEPDFLAALAQLPTLQGTDLAKKYSSPEYLVFTSKFEALNQLLKNQLLANQSTDPLKSEADDQTQTQQDWEERKTAQRFRLKQFNQICLQKSMAPIFEALLPLGTHQLFAEMLTQTIEPDQKFKSMTTLLEENKIDDLHAFQDLNLSEKNHLLTAIKKEYELIFTLTQNIVLKEAAKNTRDEIDLYKAQNALEALLGDQTEDQYLDQEIQQAIQDFSQNCDRQLTKGIEKILERSAEKNIYSLNMQQFFNFQNSLVRVFDDFGLEMRVSSKAVLPAFSYAKIAFSTEVSDINGDLDLNKTREKLMQSTKSVLEKYKIEYQDFLTLQKNHDLKQLLLAFDVDTHVDTGSDVDGQPTEINSENQISDELCQKYHHHFIAAISDLPIPILNLLFTKEPDFLIKNAQTVDDLIHNIQSFKNYLKVAETCFTKDVQIKAKINRHIRQNLGIISIEHSRMHFYSELLFKDNNFDLSQNDLDKRVFKLMNDFFNLSFLSGAKKNTNTEKLFLKIWQAMPIQDSKEATEKSNQLFDLYDKLKLVRMQRQTRGNEPMAIWPNPYHFYDLCEKLEFEPEKVKKIIDQILKIAKDQQKPSAQISELEKFSQVSQEELNAWVISEEQKQKQEEQDRQAKSIWFAIQNLILPKKQVIETSTNTVDDVSDQNNSPKVAKATKTVIEMAEFNVDDAALEMPSAINPRSQIIENNKNLDLDLDLTTKNAFYNYMRSLIPGVKIISEPSENNA